MSDPPPEVLAAFGVRDEPARLPQGMVGAWRAGDLVLKEVSHPVEHAWVCELFDAWPRDAAVRVPRPVRAPDGGWEVDGWAAHHWLPGEIVHAPTDPGWFRAVWRELHKMVADLPRPAYLDSKGDPWTRVAAIAFDGVEPVGSPETLALVRAALDAYEPVALEAQVIHADLAGNVLRDGSGRAGVIDWQPYFLPRGFSLAVVGLDAVSWQGADSSLLEEWGDEPAWGQLLLRAVVFREATLGVREANEGVVFEALEERRRGLDACLAVVGRGR